ncbi:MAG: zinc-dependent metalloprotease, partial [Bacteriovoracales bacterium]
MGKLPLIIFFLLSCNKETQGFKSDFKTNRFTDYDVESVYLYVPSTLGTPRKISAIKPFYKGSELLVKLKWTKNGLSIYASDEDTRFDFSRNQNPVFTIPGVFKDFKCPPNGSGGCSVEDHSKKWDERPYFFPELDKIDFKSSLNLLDLTFDDDGCFIERATNVLNFEIKRGVINFELEKEYVVSKNEHCIAKYLFAEGLRPQDLSFKTNFFYSLVRLKDLVSKEYIPRPYSIAEQETFGFFKNTQQIYDENYYGKMDISNLNRWNPTKKKITYYLSDSFNEEGNDHFRQITIKAFEDINKVFKGIKIPFTLELLPPSRITPGDLRFNMINLVTDPLEDIMLGYGPTISNPLTGEIVSASVNLYSEVLKKIIPKVYKGMEITSQVNAKILNSTFSRVAKTIDLIENWPGRKPEILLDSVENFPLVSNRMDPRVTASSDYFTPENSIKVDTSKLGKNTYLENLEYLTKNNAYPSELYLNGGKGRTYLDGILEFKEIWNPDNTLKKWEILNENQKRKVTDIILPHAFRTILIHELGHNLGLRHNFMGSVDKKNFYTDKDFESSPDGKKSLFGIELSNKPNFSTIMDYGFSEISELPIFGKYDIAALRFAYNGEVENENGEFKKIDELGNRYFKKYAYCSDEAVGSSVFCNYFDEGTNYYEIMQHYSKKYEDFYEATNFRNNQDNFNLLGNGAYLFLRKAQFERVRKIFETWEVFANQEISDLKDNSLKEQRLKIKKKLDFCQGKDDLQCKFILDLDNATKLAGRFFLKILKTPNHECLVAFDKFEKIVPLNFLHRALGLPQAPKSCFDSIIPTIKDGGKIGIIKGERGKYLTDLSEYNLKYSYSSDLSARGIWIDKILAVKYLIGRSLSIDNFKDPHLSFLDHPIIGPEIEKYIEDMILQQPMDNSIPFKDKMGREVKEDLDFQKSVLSGENNPVIPQQISLGLIFELGLPTNSSFFLSTAILKTIIDNSKVIDPSILKKSEEFLTHLGVKKVDEGFNLDLKKYFPEIVLSNGFKYAGSESFTLASNIISDLNYFNFLNSYKTLQDYFEKNDPPMTQEKLKNLLSKIYYLKMN